MNQIPPHYRVLRRGDPAPWFRQRSTSSEGFNFDTVAGRWLVLCFFGSAADDLSREALRLIDERREEFDDEHASFFGISLDPADEKERRVGQQLPGVRMFWDYDGRISREYGVIPIDAVPGSAPLQVSRLWYILDPMLRVRAVIPFSERDGGRRHVAAELTRLPPVSHYAGIEVHAPVLILPDVFEPALCRELIEFYLKHGGEDSGFMREVGGKTVGLLDYAHKSRKDCLIEDESLIERTRERVRRRIAPEVKKAHQFDVTRMERYIVACYEAEARGHFRAHRDNTTRGTAHRRFAVSINLSDGFEGGEIMFPEFGPRRYKAPPGCAVVFSCSLLHQVTPVTTGRRFVFLPFLYDDAAARLRIESNRHLGDGVSRYDDGSLGSSTAAPRSAGS